MMSSLLDRISELEQQLAVLRAEVEKEEKDPNKRWRAEEGGMYWFVLGAVQLDWRHEYNKNIDIFNYDTHNYFQTEEEARRYAKVIETERQLKKFADEHNGKIDKIDWSDNDSVKHYLCYNYIKQSIFIDSAWARRYPRVIYFSSKEIAQQAMTTIGEDKIKEYLTYEW